MQTPPGSPPGEEKSRVFLALLGSGLSLPEGSGARPTAKGEAARAFRGEGDWLCEPDTGPVISFTFLFFFFFFFEDELRSDFLGDSFLTGVTSFRFFFFLTKESASCCS